jgi:type IV secretory pathway TraG/TraD family ATPase VirD4
MIPPERADDVVLVDTSDPASTACLNPLEGMQDDPLHAQFVAGEIVSLIDMLLEIKDSSGPRARSALRNLLLLSASTPGRHGTLLDVLRILEDSDYCDYLLAKCKDRNVVDFWAKFRKTQGSENGFAEWLPYLMARFEPFTSNPIMKRLLCRPDSTINLGQALAERKIVLFNLNKGVLQEAEVQVLGSLILMKFFAAALGRARLPAEQRTPFHLYVDEFQSFANDASPRFFSESRKFGLCLTTANQSLGQLTNRWGRSNIAESILANTASKFLFRLGPSDIEILAPYFQPQFDAGDMANLPDFHAVACMSDRNHSLPPFVFRANLATTLPEVHVPASELMERSRQRYGVPTALANKELMELYDLSAETLGGPAHERETDLDSETTRPIVTEAMSP